ncbi:MAG: alpha-amylase family glycosyl hydrolase [Candidatus Woesearchaeota archaeon]
MKEFNTIHILPFYPSTSDGGFAVSNYIEVDKQYGTWKEIQAISKTHKLMFDCVINHTSSKHPWFQKAIKGDKKYMDYYIHYEKPPKHDKVFRPRTHPLFTKYNTYYWTTFSADQIDLNFENPQVQKEIENVFETYAQKGARYLRLDAIAYLFKDLKTSCINLKRVHTYLKNLKKRMPKSLTLISEVNLTDAVVDQYRDKGLAYNFALPSLVYYTLLTGDGKIIKKYLNTKRNNSFNFLASHDGIGLTAGRVYLKEKLNLVINDVKKKGFNVSYGGKIPYELNINYFEAMDRNEQKMLCAHAILLAVQGIPAIYYHSLFGSYGVKNIKTPRDTNRARINYEILEKQLKQNTKRKRIYEGITKIMKERKKYKAFSPQVPQKVSYKNGLLVIRRGTGSQAITCIHNITSSIIRIPKTKDLLTNMQIESLAPYQYIWIKN